MLVVDDNPAVRLMLRMQFEDDPRFELAGEAADGAEGTELAEQTQPDLVVLDRQMPGVGGIEALPDIRRVAPAAAVILYTTELDPQTERSAFAAGVLDVVEKTDPSEFVRRLESTLIGAAGEDDVEITIGPVSSEAARLWIESTTRILEAVAADPGVLDEPLPNDVIELFRSFLDEWRTLAAHGREFHWSARANATDVQRVVEQWALVDAMDDDQLERLGVQWSPPDARPFFAALTGGVLEALRRHDQTLRLAERLTQRWG